MMIASCGFYFGLVPGKNEILRVLPLVLSDAPEPGAAFSSGDKLHPDESEFGLADGTANDGSGSGWWFDDPTGAGTAVGVLQQMVQILMFGSLTKVQNSHIHSKVGAAGGGPTGPWSSGSAFDCTGSALMIRSISGSTGSGLGAFGFGCITSGFTNAGLAFKGLVVQKSLELSSTDDC